MGQTVSPTDPMGKLLVAAKGGASAVELVESLLAEPSQVAQRTVAALSASGNALAAPILLVLAESAAPAPVRKEAPGEGCTDYGASASTCPDRRWSVRARR